jgi:hypothetical protein
VAKDRSKDILREIKSLRFDLEARLEAIESRLDGVEPEGSASVSTTKFPSLPDSKDPPGGGRRVRPLPVEAPVSMPSSLRPGSHEVQTPASRREIGVVVRPLRDLALAQVIESAIAETDGVHSAHLRELSGDSALIDAVIDSSVSLGASLRQKLPVAFDLTETDDDTYTITLAQPTASERAGSSGDDAG